jgi:hypothetical protein
VPDNPLGFLNQSGGGKPQYLRPGSLLIRCDFLRGGVRTLHF